MSNILSHVELWQSRIREYEKLFHQTDKIQTKVPDSCKVFIVRSLVSKDLEKRPIEGSSQRELQSYQGIYLGASESQEGCSQ